MIVGFLTIIIWDNIAWGAKLYSLVPGFTLALATVIGVSLLEPVSSAQPAHDEGDQA
jgi:ABC-type transport system involved in cytochrome c biogenesis permease subunit